MLRTISRNDENASRSEKALTTHEQAVTLLRRLVVEQPARHLPDLAWALISLGAVLNMVGRQGKDARRFDQALAAQQEAISLLGELADEYPARYQPDIAYALRDRAIVLRNQDRQDEALAAYQESRDLYKALTNDQPWHSDDVTKLDQTIRKLRRDLGRDEESVKFAP